MLRNSASHTVLIIAINESGVLFTYGEVLLVGGIAQVPVHLVLKQALLMPFGPDRRVRAEDVFREELLVSFEFFVDHSVALEATILHQI